MFSNEWGFYFIQIKNSIFSNNSIFFINYLKFCYLNFLPFNILTSNYVMHNRIIVIFHAAKILRRFSQLEYNRWKCYINEEVSREIVDQDLFQFA